MTARFEVKVRGELAVTGRWEGSRMAGRLSIRPEDDRFLDLKRDLEAAANIKDGAGVYTEVGLLSDPKTLDVSFGRISAQVYHLVLMEGVEFMTMEVAGDFPPWPKDRQPLRSDRAGVMY